MVTVKRGDTHNTTWKTNANLTGASVRLLAREKSTKVLNVLDATITNASQGIVTHKLTGTLLAGDYHVELEITRDDGVTSAPSNGYERLCVLPDLG